MTKVNITLIKEFGEEPIALYYLYRGETMQTLVKALTTFLEKGSLTEGAFEEWVRESFSTLADGLAEAVWVKGAYIYFDRQGRRTKYSIVFDATHSQVLVWRWERCVFVGSIKAALTRLKG